MLLLSVDNEIHNKLTYDVFEVQNNGRNNFEHHRLSEKMNRFVHISLTWLELNTQHSYFA